MTGKCCRCRRQKCNTNMNKEPDTTADVGAATNSGDMTVAKAGESCSVSQRSASDSGSEGRPSSLASVEYRVYIRRYFVLLSYALTMFASYMSSVRHTAVVPSYAKYHGITNQLSAPPIWGVDSFALSTNLVSIFAYVPLAYLIDRYGLSMMTLGSFMNTLIAWGWYFSRTNINLVVLANAASGFSTPLVSASILTISNRWYPPQQRVKATAIGGLIGVIGAACGLMVSPLFATDKSELVDLTLLSCDKSKVSPVTKKAFAAANKMYCTGVHLKAKNAFCCYLPVDIEKLNLSMAILTTAAFVFTLFSVRNNPPTPPAASGEAGKYVNTLRSLKKMLKNQRFMKLSLSDFLISGPPLIAVGTLARIYPAEIAHLARWTPIVSIICSIPATMITSHFLDKSKYYFSYVMGGYLSNTLCWAVATLCIYLTSQSIFFSYLFVVTGTCTLTIYICWQPAALETKTEYTFEEGVSSEGLLVASDRIILNISNFVFVSALPPERVGGAKNSFLIGLFVMIAGCIPATLIRDKFRYKRLEFDRKNGGEFDLYPDDIEIDEGGDTKSFATSASHTSHFSGNYPTRAAVQTLPGA